MTLIELLLVMGLIALVTGAGLGLFASLDPGSRAAVALVQNLVRSARNTAIARSAPARVRIDRGAGTIVAEGMQVIGTWHFEDTNLRGAPDLDGVLLGWDEGLTSEGFVGSALSFVGAPRGARAEFPVQDDPAFDLEQGFAIDLVLRPQRLSQADILTLGDAFELRATAGGGVRASFHRKVTDNLGMVSQGGPVSVASPAGLLRPGRWTRLRVLYDRRALRLLVEGVELARFHTDVPVWRVAGPLVLGGGSTPFPGALDELVIAVVAGEEAAQLPDGVEFGALCPPRIEFLAGGALDPTVHAGPLRIPVVFDDGRSQEVLVSLYGTVE